MNTNEITPGALLAYRASRHIEPAAAIATGPMWVRPTSSGYVQTAYGYDAAGILVLTPSHADVVEALKKWAANEADQPMDLVVPAYVHEHVEMVARRLNAGEPFNIYNRPELAEELPPGWTWTICPARYLARDYREAMREHLRKSETKARRTANRAKRLAATGSRVGEAKVRIEKLVGAQSWLAADSESADTTCPNATIDLKVLERLIELAERAEQE